MSNQSTSGDGGATSGATGSKDKSQDTSGSKSYPADFVEKLKGEKENLVKSVSEMRAELERVKGEQQSREKQELEAKQEYKRLYEAEKANRENLFKEHSSLKEQINQAKVNSSIRSELVKLGLDESHLEAALRLVDKKIVNIDPGTQVVVGADEAAKQFHAAYSSLGFFKKAATAVNNAASTNVNPGPVDYSKMSQEEKIRALAQRRKST